MTSRLQRAVEAAWYTPRLTPVAVGLWPLTFAYRAAARLNRVKHSRHAGAQRFPVPIIAIGNLTVGGSGKTPLTLWLCKSLIERGFRPGVVSRGYPASPHAPCVVHASDTASRVGDESLMFAQAGLPVVVCAKRALAVAALLNHAPKLTHIIADDALQHAALRADLRLCVIEGSRGLGNGLTLPAGPLREPASALARMDAVVLNGTLASGLPAMPAPCFQMQTRLTHWTRLAEPDDEHLFEELGSRKTVIVSGIGQPERFVRDLAAVGVTGELQAFADHHAFQPDDLSRLPKDCRIIVTEKDAVKLSALKLSEAVTDRIAVAHQSVTVEPNLLDFILNHPNCRRHGPQAA